MCYHLKGNFLLYDTQLTPNPARSTHSPRQVTYFNLFMKNIIYFKEKCSGARKLAPRCAETST